jgi:hypothetical protein
MRELQGLYSIEGYTGNVRRYWRQEEEMLRPRYIRGGGGIRKKTFI